MPQLAKLQLSGGFRLTAADGRDVAIASRKARGLLAILALSPGRSATRARLRGLLWSDRGEQQAGDSLRQLLATLRRELAEAGLDIIQSHDDTLTLAACAVAEIDETNAIEHHHGELLAGLDVGDNAFEEWLAAERRTYADRMIAIFERVAAKESGATRVAAARKLAAIDPLREASHRALIAALIANGEQALAKKQLEACREILKRELGVAPSPETEALLTAAAPSHAPTTWPVIAVLPFDDLSGDQSQRYFSEGIGRDIATELARFREFVIRPCRRDQQNAAGSEYTISGSVRRNSTTVRITVQLDDTATGVQLWGDKFDAGENDIFDLQDRIVQSIAARLASRLNLAGLEKSNRKPPASLAAYELVLRAETWFGDPEREHEAVPLFTKAIELDPQCARAYAGLGEILTLLWTLDYGTSDAPLKRGLALVEKAVALDPADASIHVSFAHVLMWDRQFERAIHHCQKAHALNPNAPVIHAFEGLLLAFRGDPAEGARRFDSALALDPHFDPGWFWRHRGAAHFIARQYREALFMFGHSQQKRDWAELYRAAAHAYLGEKEAAKAAVAAALALNPQLTIGLFAPHEPYARPEDAEHLAHGLRLAGLPE